MEALDSQEKDQPDVIIDSLGLAENDLPEEKPKESRTQDPTKRPWPPEGRKAFSYEKAVRPVADGEEDTT